MHSTEKYQTVTYVSSVCEKELEQLVIIDLGMPCQYVDETLKGLFSLFNELPVG